MWVDIHDTYHLNYSTIEDNIFPMEEANDEKASSQQMLDKSWIESFYGKRWKDCLNSLRKEYDLDTVENYKLDLEKFDSLRKTLPNYGIEYNANEENPQAETVGKGLKSMGNYLVNWYYTDIIIAENGVQPFCNRGGQFLVAKKTKFTEKQEKSWLESIKEFEGNKK